MTYAWIITTDHLPEHRDEAGTIGPRSITPEDEMVLRGALAAVQSGLRIESSLSARLANLHAFRMFDDDGTLYYEGLYMGDAASEEAFGPLDDFGTPNAGCTRIDYLSTDGAWRTL